MSAKIRNRHRLKKKEIRELIHTLKSSYSSEFINEHSSIETGALEEYTVILVDDDIDFLIHENHILFTVRGLLKYQPKERYVIVDMGAVGFVTNGADIMAPGIVDADDTIQENDFVWICDQTHKKPLAVGRALMAGEEMKSSSKGKAIQNIHYVGDTLWNLTSKT